MGAMTSLRMGGEGRGLLLLKIEKIKLTAPPAKTGLRIAVASERICEFTMAHREAIQKQIQQDWANREYIEVITESIKKIADFLNSFGMYQLILILSNNVSCVL
jgi:hypothetical protein